MRVTPLLIPRLSQYANRVAVHVRKWGEVPEADLVAKIISGTVDDAGNYHEYYALMRGGDPEGFMDLRLTEDGVLWCEVSRSCHAAVDIYLDEVLVASFPELTPLAEGEMPVWPGYTNFEIPSE